MIPFDESADPGAIMQLTGGNRMRQAEHDDKENGNGPLTVRERAPVCRGFLHTGIIALRRLEPQKKNSISPITRPPGKELEMT